MRKKSLLIEIKMDWACESLMVSSRVLEHSLTVFAIVNNLRLKLDRAAISLEDLAAKGPMKPEELRGFKDYDEYVKNEDITTINGLKKMPPRVGIREVPEETHYRTGWLLSEEMTKIMLD